MEQPLIGASTLMKEFHRDKSDFLRHEVCSLGLRLGGSGGTWYPGPGLGVPVLKGPGRVQVSALSFGIAP